MKRSTCYINGAGIISPQKTFANEEFLKEVRQYEHNVLTCITPDFKEYVNPLQLRRLSRMLRIGLTASIICARDSKESDFYDVITATGYGFLNDTARFLSEILEQNEEDVTPTFFMQSTYNALAGVVALYFKCKGYNNNYVSKGCSFEMALHDAMMQLSESESRSFLVGSFDEADEVQYKINSRAGYYKTEHINSLDLFRHPSRGSVQGEGAAFFSLCNHPSESSWCILENVKMVFRPESVDAIVRDLHDFLSANNLAIYDVDVFVNGMSGDPENDRFLISMATKEFGETPEVRFKHLCGEYCTASSFGVWIGASILKKQEIPSILKFNSITKSLPYKTVLIVNQYMGRNYSFILLQKV